MTDKKHRSRLLAVIAVASAMFSCGSSDLSFDVDSSFSSDERNEFLRAQDEWNALTVQSRQFSIDSPSSWRVEKSVPPNGWYGATWFGAQRIAIRPGANVHAVSLHELGHVLGLEHLCEPPNCPERSLGVMDPNNTADAFSEADMKECRRVGACP